LRIDSTTPTSSHIFTTETSPNVQLRAETPNTVIPHPQQKLVTPGHSSFVGGEHNSDFHFDNNNDGEFLSNTSGLNIFDNNIEHHHGLARSMAYSDYHQNPPHSPGWLWVTFLSRENTFMIFN